MTASAPGAAPRRDDRASPDARPGDDRRAGDRASAVRPATPLLQALVVDDEPLARQRIVDRLAGAPGVVVAGEAASGRVAVEAIRRLAPDLVFLDVQMPGLSGLDVVREVGPEAMPVTVFVTAFDAHAIAAFDAAATDYLLKPFEDARFDRALARACAAARGRRDQTRLPDSAPDAPSDASPDAPRVAVTPPGRAPAEAGRVYLDRFTVETRGAVRFVPVADVEYVTAEGPYAILHARGERLVVRESMQVLEARLDPAVFARIHRSTIVRLDRVERLRVARGGRYLACLHDGTQLRVSRTRYDALTVRLSGDLGPEPG